MSWFQRFTNNKPNENPNPSDRVRNMKLAVVCYGNFFENPGPAVFAKRLAMSLKDDFEVTLIGTYKENQPKPGATEEFFVIDRDLSLFGTRLSFLYKRYINFGLLIKLLWIITRRKIDIVNLHNLAMKIPLVIIPITKILGKRVVVTCHDYTAIYNRKLYPSDLSRGSGKSDLTKILEKPILTINKLCLQLADKVVYLSELQQKHYVAFGFHQGVVIENKIQSCDCPEFSETRLLEEAQTNHILFLGRRIGKGLDQLVQWIARQDTFKLRLAGDSELVEVAKHYLESNKFQYLGNLSPREVAKVIHLSEVVYVVSDCLDVFPTTVLEGIVHGTPVLTSSNCGNAHLVERVASGFVIQSIFELDPITLLGQLAKWKKSPSLSTVQAEVTNIREWFCEFTTLLHQLS